MFVSEETGSAFVLDVESFRKRKLVESPRASKKARLDLPLVWAFQERRNVKTVTHKAEIDIKNRISFPSSTVLISGLPFESDSRFLLVRNSNRAGKEGSLNYSSSFTNNSCRTCLEAHPINTSPKLLFLGDQSVPACVGGYGTCCLTLRGDNASLKDLGNLLFTQMREGLTIKEGSVIAVYSQTDLLRLGSAMYLRALDVLKDQILKFMSGPRGQGRAGEGRAHTEIVATIFPLTSVEEHAMGVYSSYYITLCGLRSVEDNRAKVLLVHLTDLEMKPHAKFSVKINRKSAFSFSMDRINYSPLCPVKTVTCNLEVAWLDKPKDHRECSAELEKVWILALLADIDEAACFGSYKLCTIPEFAVECGIARKWSRDLGEKVCPSPAPAWTTLHLQHEQPVADYKTQQGRIILIGESNVFALNSSMSKSFETKYVRSGRADSELVGVVMEGLTPLAPNCYDSLVINVTSNSFIKSIGKNQYPSLAASKGGHLIDPSGLSETELLMMTENVQQLVQELRRAFPETAILVYGPIPRFMPQCCEKHANGQEISREIRRVEERLRAKLSGFTKVKFSSSLNPFIDTEHYLKTDRVHLNAKGLEILGGDVIRCLGGLD